ncbi:MAG: carboxymuconolactone decarboxylase family protein [candidate division NC10 bacterium]|nr:carboxymuconolactone decarboxylase family protein [candidate division NC10 bacterium]
MEKLPAPYRQFMTKFREVWEAYNQLGAACHEGGPLDRKTRELAKLGMAIGGRLEGAVHAHTRLALEAGATPEEIRHVVLLALPTVGFPSMMATMTWVDDVLRKGTKSSRRPKR